MHCSLLAVKQMRGHYNFEVDDVMKVDDMNVMIRVLHLCYTNADYCCFWKKDKFIKEVRRSSLIKVPDVRTLRRAQQEMLARYGKMQSRALPFKVRNGLL